MSLAAGQVVPGGRDLPSECVMIGRPRARRSEGSALGLLPAHLKVRNGSKADMDRRFLTSNLAITRPACRLTQA